MIKAKARKYLFACLQIAAATCAADPVTEPTGLQPPRPADPSSQLISELLYLPRRMLPPAAACAPAADLNSTPAVHFQLTSSDLRQVLAAAKPQPALCRPHSAATHSMSSGKQHNTQPAAEAACQQNNANASSASAEHGVSHANLQVHSHKRLKLTPGPQTQAAVPSLQQPVTHTAPAVVVGQPPAAMLLCPAQHLQADGVQAEQLLTQQQAPPSTSTQPPATLLSLAAQHLQADGLPAKQPCTQQAPSLLLRQPDVTQLLNPVHYPSAHQDVQPLEQAAQPTTQSPVTAPCEDRCQMARCCQPQASQESMSCCST